MEAQVEETAFIYGCAVLSGIVAEITNFDRYVSIYQGCDSMELELRNI